VTGIAILLAQLAAPAAAQTLPDIEIRARVQAERVEVKQQGEAKLELQVDPGATEPVRVERSAPPGQARYRNLTIELQAEARIAGPNAAVTTSASRKPTGEPE
jgi:hypothetical protein